MTNEEAIRHLLNDWFIASSGRVVVDADEKDAFIEAIGVAVKALYRQKDHQKCARCKWIGGHGDCTCEDSKYFRFLTKPEDSCDQWEEG